MRPARVAAARMGRSVVVIEPSDRVGGLTTGGLGQTDIGNKQAIGGIAREFYRAVKRHYADPAAWKCQDRAAYRSGGQTGDRRILAYTFRMCLTDHPDNRIPFRKPKGYDPLSHELLLRNFEAGEKEVPWINARMPNRKTSMRPATCGTRGTCRWAAFHPTPSATDRSCRGPSSVPICWCRSACRRRTSPTARFSCMAAMPR
jgi:hypothetical protein